MFQINIDFKIFFNTERNIVMKLYFYYRMCFNNCILSLTWKYDNIQNYDLQRTSKNNSLIFFIYYFQVRASNLEDTLLSPPILTTRGCWVRLKGTLWTRTLKSPWKTATSGANSTASAQKWSSPKLEGKYTLNIISLFN